MCKQKDIIMDYEFNNDEESIGEKSVKALIDKEFIRHDDKIRELRALLKEEQAEKILAIKETIKKYGLSAKDLGLVRERKTYAPVYPKYRDPVTGKTWSGRGLKPIWARVDNLEEYRIS